MGATGSEAQTVINKSVHVSDTTKHILKHHNQLFKVRQTIICIAQQKRSNYNDLTCLCVRCGRGWTDASCWTSKTRLGPASGGPHMGHLQLCPRQWTNSHFPGGRGNIMSISVNRSHWSCFWRLMLWICVSQPTTWIRNRVSSRLSNLSVQNLADIDAGQ